MCRETNNASGYAAPPATPEPQKLTFPMTPLPTMRQPQFADIMELDMERRRRREQGIKRWALEGNHNDAPLKKRRRSSLPRRGLPALRLLPLLDQQVDEDLPRFFIPQHIPASVSFDDGSDCESHNDEDSCDGSIGFEVNAPQVPPTMPTLALYRRHQLPWRLPALLPRSSFEPWP